LTGLIRRQAQDERILRLQIGQFCPFALSSVKGLTAFVIAEHINRIWIILISMTGKGDDQTDIRQAICLPRRISMKIYQPGHGYRFAADTVALADFVRISPTDSLLDLGTGVGVIPLLLWQRCGFRVAAGVEVQKELVCLARRNVRQNELKDRLFIVRKNLVHLDPSDFQSIPGLSMNGKFDVVTANPPYWPMGRGRLNPNSQRAAARHEVYSTFRQLLDVCSRFLKPGGRFYFVQVVERKSEILEDLARSSFQMAQVKLLRLTSKDLMLVEADYSPT
jgi:tRNA1Val (adenine37-N6)-methyltransferase